MRLAEYACKKIGWAQIKLSIDYQIILNYFNWSFNYSYNILSFSSLIQQIQLLYFKEFLLLKYYLKVIFPYGVD